MLATNGALPVGQLTNNVEAMKASMNIKLSATNVIINTEHKTQVQCAKKYRTEK